MYLSKHENTQDEFYILRDWNWQTRGATSNCHGLNEVKRPSNYFFNKKNNIYKKVLLNDEKSGVYLFESENLHIRLSRYGGSYGYT